MESPGHARHVALPDGRRLAYAEYGDRGGTPLVLLHGSPGSRLWFADDDPVATRAGIRLLALDRPGYGGSDPAPTGTLVEAARDVVHFADALGLEAFALLGVSGGGPYAAACAAVMGDRLTRVFLVSSPAPPDARVDLGGVAWGNRISYLLGRRAPWLVRWLTRAGARQFARDVPRGVAHLATQVCASDQRVLADPATRTAITAHFAEGYRGGIAGHQRDAALMLQEWGFRVEEIAVPVDIWHGEADTLVPLAMARALAARIPHATLTIVPAGGHLLCDLPATWTAILARVPRRDSAA